MKFSFVLLSFLLNYCTCRDFYVGMFKKNDFIVAQDNLYQERIPYRFSNAKYGRLFKCPITYIRVVDRLGIGRGPRVQITRGGLGKKYVVLRLTSQYNNPISVNIYIGCENKMKTTELIRKVLTTTEPIETTITAETTSEPSSESTSETQPTAESTTEETTTTTTTTVPPPGN